MNSFHWFMVSWFPYKILAEGAQNWSAELPLGTGNVIRPDSKAG